MRDLSAQRIPLGVEEEQALPQIDALEARAQGLGLDLLGVERVVHFDPCVGVFPAKLRHLVGHIVALPPVRVSKMIGVARDKGLKPPWIHFKIQPAQAEIPVIARVCIFKNDRKAVVSPQLFSMLEIVRHRLPSRAPGQIILHVARQIHPGAKFRRSRHQCDRMPVADIDLPLVRHPAGDAFEGIAKAQIGVGHAPAVLEQPLVVFGQKQRISARPELANGNAVWRRGIRIGQQKHPHHKPLLCAGHARKAIGISRIGAPQPVVGLIAQSDKKMRVGIVGMPLQVRLKQGD